MVLVWQHGVIVPPWSIDQPDVSQNVWNLWHLINTWQSGNPLLTTAVLYPQQLNLMYQSYGLAQAVLVLPIVAVWGPIAGANAILALGYWGGAFGVFVLIWALSKRPGSLLWWGGSTPLHRHINTMWPGQLMKMPPCSGLCCFISDTRPGVPWACLGDRVYGACASTSNPDAACD